jgi:plastocyanin
MSKRVRMTAAIAAAAALALPAAASAATKVVGMGPAGKDAKALNKLTKNHDADFLDVNAFFPRGTTIHVGDRIRFLPRGFHTVDLPARGGSPTALFAPTGAKENQADAAGHPFWWNGLDVLSFNPALFSGGFGKKLTYTGAKAINTGLPLGPAKPMTVKFSKAGTYTYFCDVHPGMTGTVKVRPKGKAIPSARADRKALRRTVAADLKTAKRVATTKPPANTVSVGAAGRGGVEYFQMFPRRLTVPAGTTVRFAMSKRSREVHTASFGPGDPNASSSYLNPILQGFEGSRPTLDGRGVYPSEPPTTLASMSSSLHGNGFWNSGVMDAARATKQIPASGALRFDAPGTYDYYCLIHSNMHGTITVK